MSYFSHMNPTNGMDYDEIFNMSYWRALGTAVDGDAFAETVYSHFLRYPEVAAKFAQADPGKPMQMLRVSLTLAASYYFSGYVSREPNHLLVKYAELHSQRHLGIEPHLYQYWLESVLQAVKVHDPQCDEKILEAWRRILTPAVEFMRSHFAT